MVLLIIEKKGTLPDQHLSLYLSLCNRYQASNTKNPKTEVFEGDLSH